MSKKALLKLATINFVSLFAAVSAYAGKSMKISLGEDGWETKNDVKFVEYQGRESIHLKGGFNNSPSAQLKELEFAEGTIEFDISIDAANSVFPGIEFHITEDGSQFERIYFRPGNNHQINSFQYHPVYQGEHPWQLYGQHQRDLSIPNKEWFHVKVEVWGSQMAFYVEGQGLPVFWTETLQSGSSKGGIRFAGAGDYHVSNLKVTKRKASGSESFNPVSWDLPDNYLSRWQVSPLLALEGDEKKVVRNRFSDLSGDWKTIEAEARGLINITRHIPKTAAHTAVLAKTVVHSDKQQSKKLFFGYSDRIELFLNGELVFSGNNTFRAKTSKMRSRPHIDNDQIVLELKEGKNELEAIVYERFGGWALMAKFESLEGINRM